MGGVMTVLPTTLTVPIIAVSRTTVAIGQCCGELRLLYNMRVEVS